MDAEMIYGNLPMILEGPDLEDGPLGEVDTLSVKILTGSNYRSDCTSLGYTRQAAVPGYGSIFVESIIPRKSGSLQEVDIRASGTAFGEKRKRIISCGGQQVSVGPVEKVMLAWSTDERGEDEGNTVDKVKRRVTKVDSNGDPEYEVFVTPSGIFDRWNIFQAIVQVTDIYFSTTLPSTTVPGTASAPPSAPGVPPFLWSGFDPLRGQHPNGWVMVDRNAEQLFPSLWRVNDSWSYFYGAMPD